MLIVSDSERLESRLIEAARLQGRDRIAATLDALTLLEQGEYLEGARSAWVDDRRARLSERVLDARLDAAELALEAGDLELRAAAGPRGARGRSLPRGRLAPDDAHRRRCSATPTA